MCKDKRRELRKAKERYRRELVASMNKSLESGRCERLF